MKPDNVDGEILGQILSLDVFGNHHLRGGSGAGDQNVNLTNGADDLGDAWEVGLGCGEGLDFEVWVSSLEGLLRIIENLLAALDDDDAANASFGEGLADGVANPGRC